MAAFQSRDHDAFMTHWKDRILGDPTVASRTVVLDGRVAGNVVSFERFGLREVGFWIGREFWGKGVATRGLSEFLSQVGTRPLYARVATRNVASIRVLEKCGFRPAEDPVPPGDPVDDVEELFLELTE